MSTTDEEFGLPQGTTTHAWARTVEARVKTLEADKIEAKARLISLEGSRDAILAAFETSLKQATTILDLVNRQQTIINDLAEVAARLADKVKALEAAAARPQGTIPPPPSQPATSPAASPAVGKAGQKSSNS